MLLVLTVVIILFASIFVILLLLCIYCYYYLMSKKHLQKGEFIKVKEQDDDESCSEIEDEGGSLEDLVEETGGDIEESLVSKIFGEFQKA